MGGKKTEKDLLSDFFGGDDDLDWLADEDEASAGASDADEAKADEAKADEAKDAAAEAGAPPAQEEPPQAAPPPPPPPPRRAPTLPPQPAPDLSASPAVPEPAPQGASDAPPATADEEDAEPQESLFAAPAESGAAPLDEAGPVDLDAAGRDSIDDTIGAFLEPLETGEAATGIADEDPDSLVTVTDAQPQRPLDDIVVEEDRAEDIADPDALGESPSQSETQVVGADLVDAAGDSVDAADEAEASGDDEPASAGEDATGEAASEDEDATSDEAAASDEADATSDDADASADEADAEDATSDGSASSDDEDASGDEHEADDGTSDQAASSDDEQSEGASSDDPAADEAAASASGDAPAAPPTPVRTWSPSDDAATWAEVLAAVEAAAADASGEAHTALLAEAARIERDRLGDVEAASARLSALGDSSDLAVLDVRADTASRSGDLAAAAAALAARAERLEGAAAAESWQAAAMIARHRLQDLETAEARLHHAVEADPADYASLSLLRDQLSVKGREEDRARVLGQISDLAGGRVAAEAWWELGRLLHRLGREDDALEAYRKGRAQDPTHAPCFLALQALHVASGDDVALGELFVEEAEREGSRDRGQWMIEAARAFVDARETERADKAFAGAIEAGHPLARREQQAWLLATERHETYIESVAAEAEATAPEHGQAYVLYRLGRAREDRDDLDGAIEAYRAAVSLDAAAGPAAEAVARALQAAGRHEELLAFWEERVDGTDEDELRASVLLRMAEVAEAGLDDDAKARGYLERILDVRSDDRPALDALRRIHQRLGAWAELAGVYETLATLEEQPDARAQHHARAGNVWRFRADDADKARAAYGKALELRPGHAIALDEQVDLLEELGDWQAQARVLRAAADALPDEADKVRVAYRAGRVWLDRLDDHERAAEAFRHCLRFQPGFLPALGMLKQIAARTGEGQEVYRLYLQQAQGLDDPAARHWRLLAAADLAVRLPGGDPGRDLGAILERDPAHPGAVAGQELRLLTMGAKVGLLNLYRRTLQGLEPGPRRTRLLIRVAGLFEALGDPSGVREPLAEAIATGAEDLPYRFLGRLAEGQRHWAEAVDALEQSGAAEDRLERARLLALRLDRGDEALEAYTALLDEPEVAVGAALASAALAQRAGDGELLLRAHTLLAEQAATEAVRAAHALWSGQLAEASEQSDEALRLYRLALELRPASVTAFDGARRQLLAAADAEGLRALWTTHRPADVHGLALDLEQVGDHAGVVTVWEQALEDVEGPAAVSLLARLELARAATEDWSGVYEAATRRAALTTDAEAKATVDAKRRWLLAEKLAGTDEAWELYKALHEENPDDRDVTSALARIALARGENRLAIGYLEALADGADSPEAAAELRVRTAEVHEAGDSPAEARQAYLDALDHVPDHRPALDGLKRLAEAAEDWEALLAVQKREAGLVEGEARRDALVEIARTTAEKLDDPAVAADAWRAVLDENAAHQPALRALMELAEAGGDHAQVLEMGGRLAETLEGEARTALLARLGDVSADELDRDDAFQLWERALSEGPPSLPAAERLVGFYRGRGDSTNTVRLLALQADLVEEPADRARLLGDAATLEAEVRHDRASAARLFQQVLEANEDDPRALRFLSEYLFEHDRQDEALPVFERLAPTIEQDQDVDDFDVRMELSTFFYRLARMLVDRGREDDALEPATKALSYNPSHQPTLELVAPLHVRHEDWKQANEVLRQLLQLTGGQGDKQKTADMYAQLGIVERALGRLDKASKRFGKALDLVPNHVQALKGMAMVLEDRQEWSALLNVYNNIIYHAPDAADVIAAYLTKGRVLDEHMGRADKAVQHYERSLAFDANQPKALLRLAELAWRREDWSEVGGLAGRGLALTSQDGPLRADLQLCVAAARKATGDEERATAALAEARSANPELELPDDVLGDLEALRDTLRARLPT